MLQLRHLSRRYLHQRHFVIGGANLWMWTSVPFLGGDNLFKDCLAKILWQSEYCIIKSQRKSVNCEGSPTQLTRLIMGIISSQDWKEIAELYSNEETSAATRAGLCHNNNDHIPHLVQCPGLYRRCTEHMCTVRPRPGTCSVLYSTAAHRTVTGSVAPCHAALHLVT